MLSRAARGAAVVRRELFAAPRRGAARGLAGAPGSKFVVEATEANFDEVVMNSKVRREPRREGWRRVWAAPRGARDTVAGLD
jgi:hypothetical protein